MCSGILDHILCEMSVRYIFSTWCAAVYSYVYKEEGVQASMMSLYVQDNVLR